MKTDKIKVIDYSFITTFHITVSEEISSKYINQFIRTTVSNSDIDTDENSYLYYNFLPYSSSYEILIFNKNFKGKFILEPFMLLSYYPIDKQINSTDLFITENYFVLFKDKEFILLKNITNIEKDDIQSYIEQSYNLTIDNTIALSKDDIKKLKNLYLKNNYDINYNFLKLQKENSFKYFIYFILLSSTIFGYLLFNKTYTKKQIILPTKKENLEEKNYKNLLNIYKKHDQNLINKTIDLFKYLKLNKITITSLKYSNKKLNLNINHKDKNKLLAFTTIYNKKIDIKSLNFLKETKNYKMEISIEY